MSPVRTPPQSPDSRKSPAEEQVMVAVAEAMARLRFGSIALTVHDGKVVQIDVTERQRFS